MLLYIIESVMFFLPVFFLSWFLAVKGTITADLREYKPYWWKQFIIVSIDTFSPLKLFEALFPFEKLPLKIISDIYYFISTDC